MLKRLLLRVMAAFVFTASAANAASLFWSINDGLWNDQNNWQRLSGTSAFPYPVAGDTAVISGQAITVDGGNSAAAALYLANGGDLQVTSGDTLTVNYCNIGHSTSMLTVAGTLQVAVLILSNGDIAVNAGGTLNMQGSAAIYGASTVAVNADGTLNMQGSAALYGTSTVAVNADGTLNMQGSAAIYGTSTLAVNAGGTVVYTGGSFDIDSTVQLNGGTFEIQKGCVHVDNNAMFRMNGGRLEIGVSEGFQLTTGSSFLEVTADAAIGGSGSLRSDTVLASIGLNVEGSDDVELTIESDVTVFGALMFTKWGNGCGLAKLTNLGQVKANIAGSAIILDASLDEINDGGGSCSSPNWYVHEDSMLEFDKGVTSLRGDFEINGVLFVMDPVTTSGKKKLAGSGTIIGDFTATGGDCP